MTPASPPTSVRLLRAAAAELSQLDRHCERLLGAREQLRKDLKCVERSLVEVDERRRLLDRLAPSASDVPAQVKRSIGGDGMDHAAAGSPAEPVKVAVERGGDSACQLRGPQIRTQAVRLLLADPGAPEALHYREWYQRLVGAGFAIAGKDPQAVFLTQLTRSPVVRKGTQAGVYEIDHHAPERLRRELEDLQAQLRGLTTPSTAAAHLAARRARRAQISKQISHAEKALEEALDLLGHRLDEIALLRAAG